jgi:hypothetical protein
VIPLISLGIVVDELLDVGLDDADLDEERVGGSGPGEMGSSIIKGALRAPPTVLSSSSGSIGCMIGHALIVCRHRPAMAHPVTR